MRLRKRGLCTVYLKKRIVDDDEESNSLITYSEESTELEMTVQSAGGKVMSTIYGERLPYVKSCKYQGDALKENQNEQDGICLYTCKEDEPDYKITAIQKYDNHLNVTLERIEQHGRTD